MLSLDVMISSYAVPIVLNLESSSFRHIIELASGAGIGWYMGTKYHAADLLYNTRSYSARLTRQLLNRPEQTEFTMGQDSLQKGPAMGMSATEGIHDSRPNLVDHSFDGLKYVAP
jgi:hypothetical protein